MPEVRAKDQSQIFHPPSTKEHANIACEPPVKGLEALFGLSYLASAVKETIGGSRTVGVWHG
jgi:hypothetical protein